MSYVPGLAATPVARTKTVKIPEFVIPKRIANAEDRLGYPAERALAVNTSNRGGVGMPETGKEKMERARARDKEGQEFLERLDRENAELLKEAF